MQSQIIPAIRAGNVPLGYNEDMATPSTHIIEEVSFDMPGIDFFPTEEVNLVLGDSVPLTNLSPQATTMVRPTPTTADDTSSASTSNPAGGTLTVVSTSSASKPELLRINSGDVDMENTPK